MRSCGPNRNAHAGRDRVLAIRCRKAAQVQPPFGLDMRLRVRNIFAAREGVRPPGTF